MTPVSSEAAWLSTLTPTLAAADWPEIIQGGGTAAVIALLLYGLKLLKDGTFRLDREVQGEHEARAVAEERAKVAEERAAVAEERADREYEARARVEDEMRTTLRPEMLKLSAEATRMVEAGAHNAEMMSQLLATLLPKMGRSE